MAMPQIQRSIPEVLRDILDNLQELIRSEFRLAKTEMKDAVVRAAKPAVTWGVGLALGLYGLGFLLLAAVYGLSTVMAGWLAALVVGAVLTLTAIGLMTSSASKLKSINPAPNKTIRSLKENAQWTKQQIR